MAGRLKKAKLFLLETIFEMLAACKTPNYENSYHCWGNFSCLFLHKVIFKSLAYFPGLFSLKPEQSEAQVTEVPQIVTLLAEHNFKSVLHLYTRVINLSWKGWEKINIRISRYDIRSWLCLKCLLIIAANARDRQELQINK